MTKSQKKQFEIYKENLLDWNTRINLTAITDNEGIWHKHFADSLTLLPLLPDLPFRMIDIGCGAGFPGLPVKIMRPDISLTLLDSTRKKICFLEDTVLRLGLEDVRCIHARAEDLIKEEKHRGGYRVCSARAVARLKLLCKWCLPFLAPGGLFLAMKGPSVEDEIKEAMPVIRKMNSEVLDIKFMEIMQGMVHTVVVLCYNGKNKE